MTYKEFWKKLTPQLISFTWLDVGDKKKTLPAAGCDSLHLVELQMAIEEVFEVHLTCEWFASERTLDELYQKVLPEVETVSA